MYDSNGFSDRLIRATEPTEKKNRYTREKKLQSVYEKCRQSNVGSFGQYIRSKITRDTLRKCGISNIDLRYIDLSSDSQLYHGGTSWEPGKSYVFTGSIDRLANSKDVSRPADDMGVQCVRLFQLDSDRNLLAVNRSAIEELCQEWYILACPPPPPPATIPEPTQQPPRPTTPTIMINGHDGTNGIEEESTAGDAEKKNGDKSPDKGKEENGKNEASKDRKGTADTNGKAETAATKTNEELSHIAVETQDQHDKAREDLFIRSDGLSLIDMCFQNERETEFYNVQGVAYEDASAGTSKDILLYHTSASASISSKDILLFDTSGLRLKQELIVPRRSAKHLVRGQNGYLRCNEPARPRAPPSIRARPPSGGRNSGEPKSWTSAETSTRDTKL